jgi:pSer/pThr/pTyr-binding forkhead associated (FHA) protein
MLKLRFKDNRQDPVWVVEKNFTIGSAEDNSLVIDDLSVSPQHAKLSDEEQTFVLKDLDSAEGTYVNGSAIKKRAINHQDVLKFGNIELTIVDPLDEVSDYTWSLIACSGVFCGKEFPLPMTDRGFVIVGRGKHCDIAFPGTHLSKQHARFTASELGLQVEDLDSENGVFINEERTRKAILRTGDKVRLDVYNFRVFGPSIDLPRPTEPSPSKIAEPVAETNPADLPPKQWITRPTSPGNREEPKVAPTKPPVLIYAFSAILIALLAGLSIYVFF